MLAFAALNLLLNTMNRSELSRHRFSRHRVALQVHNSLARNIDFINKFNKLTDTYTKDELERCSLFCLTDFSGPKEVFVGLRDRAMLLLSTTTAFRGASCRAVELSDLFPSSLPSLDPNEDGSGTEVPFDFHTLRRNHADISYYGPGPRNTTGQREAQPDGPYRRARSHSSSPPRTLSHRWCRYAAVGYVSPSRCACSQLHPRLLKPQVWRVRAS